MMIGEKGADIVRADRGRVAATFFVIAECFLQKPGRAPAVCDPNALR